MQAVRRWMVAVPVALVLLALPATAQVSIDRDDDENWNRGWNPRRVVERVIGQYDWVIDESDVFGIQVDNILMVDALKRANGAIDGRIFYRQKFLDNDFLVVMTVSCMEVYDGNRIKIGGPVEVANDPRFDGLYGWFQATDDRYGPDVSTVVGFGDEQENEEFCASDALPQFGPWEIDGRLKVRERRRGNDDDSDSDSD